MTQKEFGKLAFLAGQYSVFKTYDAWWEHFSTKQVLSSQYDESRERYIYCGKLIVFMVKKGRVYSDVLDEQGTPMKVSNSMLKEI